MPHSDAEVQALIDQLLALCLPMLHTDQCSRRVQIAIEKTLAEVKHTAVSSGWPW